MAYQPTFVLKKVDPIKVIEQYKQNVYKNASIPLNKINVEAAFIPSITGASQSFRDKNNCLIVIHTTNNEAIKSLPTYKPRCFWCMQDLSKNISSHVPIPTGLHIIRSVEDDSLTYYFETNAGGSGGGSCCSFECALSFVRNFNNGTGSGTRSFSNESIEIFLKALYKLCYPDKGDLRQAPDFRLLQQYAGTMTVDEFINTKSEFIQLPNLILNSVSDQFMSSLNK